MSNLESFVSHWRQTLSSAGHLKPETLAELEGHLREKIEQLIQMGVPEMEACERAAAELGDAATLADEFRKLEPAPWLPARIATVTGISLTAGLALLLLARFFTGSRRDVLLAVHAFTVTVGYGAVILLGALGACFVVQRARCGFPVSRLKMLDRVILGFVVISTIGTVIGVILGMFWANREWGRYWDWDQKEIGGLSVIIWMIGSLVAYAWGRIGTRGLLVASLLGSNVVLLAWFAPAFLSGLNAYGSVNAIWAILPVALILNLSLAVLGLAPSGCARART